MRIQAQIQTLSVQRTQLVNQISDLKLKKWEEFNQIRVRHLSRNINRFRKWSLPRKILWIPTTTRQQVGSSKKACTAKASLRPTWMILMLWLLQVLNRATKIRSRLSVRDGSMMSINSYNTPEENNSRKLITQKRKRSGMSTMVMVDRKGNLWL